MSNNQIDQQPLVTLLSDFGDRDVYVGIIKGVIAQINPRLTLVDLTHQIPPQDIAAARFSLMNAYAHFPMGTVHLAVVDPGVGSKRRAIAVEFTQGFLVGPDNGIFSGVLSQSLAIAAVELTNLNYWRTSQPSKTFHGRDIFAPVAANLASGVPLKQLGQEIDPVSLVNLDIGNCKQTTTGVVGCIQYIDHFGNLVSNIPASYVQGKNWYVQVAGLSVPGCETYSDVKVGEIIALVGSHGWVEIAINCGNAHSQLQINLQDALEVLFF
ncbi:SAM hydrolase/SAM-dependent halogenase family protein [Nostoc sp. 'Lobaria pulmonaria (5183) cyanobiont']|uniref:SAM hydrolase/SAM-dependent halogenase family protein n=1 Tax=Nostoc sp. 'Lobaria pulmonaria (5183) cyanobiont' TaxID=1618022 RepID=UPI000CF3090A|nr:SAM-dependent chlorinase/fluorinase [Nostoc sp. 'Lobaria pulmonaria (5183) cyanobiont']AVH73951.1 S-adenosyl-L-methionine hydroxide adenosyltransferase [Nostoc sp. 'Lobaria pulmonaria (5183) cyanobiont']